MKQSSETNTARSTLETYTDVHFKSCLLVILEKVIHSKFVFV